jgi:pimeloyl-ACP methyl ester carboxylesterase
VLPRPGRRLAFLDYGPVSAPPVLVFHGFMAGRSLPPALVSALHRQGLRPIVPQRPGFGLTSAAAGDYLDAASDDLAALVDTLGFRRVRLFARDGGVAAALAFAQARPGFIRRGVLLNPRPPHGLTQGQRSGPVAQITRLLLSRPHLIRPLGEFLRRRTRSDAIVRILRESLRTLPQDLAVLDEPAALAQLVRDIQAQFAHGCEGYAAEHALYAQGWTPPQVAGDGAWTVLHAGGLATSAPPATPWLALPDVDFQILPGAGVLAQFTHAEAIAASLSA